LQANSRSRPNREFRAAQPGIKFTEPGIFREVFRPLHLPPKIHFLSQKLALYEAGEEKEFGLLPQLLDQRLCPSEVGRLEPLGEPIVDRYEKLTPLCRPAPIAPHPRETRGGAQLPG
jgi:hypothetical protein